MRPNRSPMWREPRYKRLFDLAIMVLAHVILSPTWVFLWLVVPTLIWLEDRGPVFYRQQRPGKDGVPFTVRKFRTMVPNADKDGPAWTVEGDKRITRVGRFLRKTAIDELPGVFSIWSGHMSLVGPRALPMDEQRYLEGKIAGFGERLKVRPGLTGLAQLYDMRDDAETKLKYDLEYIGRMSIWLDLKILVISIANTIAIRWDRRSGKATQSGL